MKKLWTCLLICLFFGLLFSCSKDNQNESENPNQINQKIAVVYFSATKTTENIAIQIADITKGRLMQILPAIPYSADDLNYTNDDCRANVEQNDENARPEIANNIDRSYLSAIRYGGENYLKLFILFLIHMIWQIKQLFRFVLVVVAQFQLV